MVDSGISSIPLWEKYILTVKEASSYFGIGEKVLRRFLDEHKDDQYIIKNGSKTLIKRKIFENYIDQNMTVL